MASAIEQTKEPTRITITPPDTRKADEETKPDSDYGFKDALDVINPLQQLPIISNIYRKLTEDDVKPVSGIIGGLLFGGLPGLVIGICNAIVHEATGESIPEKILNAMSGDSEDTESGVEVAHNNNAATAYSDASSLIRGNQVSSFLNLSIVKV